MERRLKDFLAFVLSVGLCAYAVRSQLQFVAIVGFIGALCVIYKGTVIRISELVFNLSGRLTQARYGGFEVQVRKEVVGESLAANAPPGLRGVLTAMTPGHVGLVLVIDKSTEFTVAGGILKQLRELRNLGLIEHDQPTLHASSQVWLTAIGREVTAFLREDKQPPSTMVAAESDGARRMPSNSSSGEARRST